MGKPVLSLSVLLVYDLFFDFLFFFFLGCPPFPVAIFSRMRLAFAIAFALFLFFIGNGGCCGPENLPVAKKRFERSTLNGNRKRNLAMQRFLEALTSKNETEANSRLKRGASRKSDGECPPGTCCLKYETPKCGKPFLESGKWKGIYCMCDYENGVYTGS